MVIYSVPLFNRLIELGCTPKKSLILKFPTKEQVPPHLMKHFIRGYVDGDGCITKTNTFKTKNTKVKIVGTVEFYQGLKIYLKQEHDIEIGASHCKRCLATGNTQTIYMDIWRQSSVEKFLDFIYDEATLFLERKYKKYIVFKKECLIKQKILKEKEQLKEMVYQDYINKIPPRKIMEKYNIKEGTMYRWIKEKKALK